MARTPGSGDHWGHPDRSCRPTAEDYALPLPRAEHGFHFSLLSLVSFGNHGESWGAGPSGPHCLATFPFQKRKQEGMGQVLLRIAPSGEDPSYSFWLV